MFLFSLSSGSAWPDLSICRKVPAWQVSKQVQGERVLPLQGVPLWRLSNKRQGMLYEEVKSSHISFNSQGEVLHLTRAYWEHLRTAGLLHRVFPAPLDRASVRSLMSGPIPESGNNDAGMSLANRKMHDWFGWMCLRDASWCQWRCKKKWSIAPLFTRFSCRAFLGFLVLWC